jgi:SAM-dependent MidA family methyltransferase
METPAERIRDLIRREGPMAFPRFMQEALYGEGGFYERPPVGPTGAFVTSPHVHTVFATLVADAIRGLHRAIGAPEPFLLTEVGAGDGTLLRALIPALDPVTVTAVEVSPGARDLLAAVPGIAHIHDALEAPFDVLIANELLDNLPFRIVRDGVEIGVGLDDDGDLAEARLGATDEPDGVVPTGALAFVDRVAEALLRRPGAALLIDYGTDEPGGAGDPHGYAGQHVVEDLLAEPGSADITAGVDFALVRARAGALGVTAFPTVSQRAALAALGFADRMREALEDQRRHLDAGEGVEAVRTWSARSRASLLVDPGALGRFRWLVLASPGVDAPDWLTEASAQEG